MEPNIILDKIFAELQKAELQHPSWPSNIFEQITIVNEELGEVNKAILHYKYENKPLSDIEMELIQTAAMCVRMLKNLSVFNQSFNI